MTIFFTSDTHFGHQNIIQYTHRPYSGVEEMNADLVDRWNSAVSPGDTVYHLGDVVMGHREETLRWVGLLNGTKFLVPGNHDKCWEHAGSRVDWWTQKYKDAGFTIILGSQIRLDLRGYSVLLSHFPYTDIGRHEGKYDAYAPEDHGDWLLHGHTHGIWRQKNHMIDVGVDSFGGRPVHVDTIVDMLSSGSAELSPLPW